MLFQQQAFVKKQCLDRIHLNLVGRACFVFLYTFYRKEFGQLKLKLHYKLGQIVQHVSDYIYIYTMNCVKLAF